MFVLGSILSEHKYPLKREQQVLKYIWKVKYQCSKVITHYWTVTTQPLVPPIYHLGGCRALLGGCAQIALPHARYTFVLKWCLWRSLKLQHYLLQQNLLCKICSFHLISFIETPNNHTKIYYGEYKNTICYILKKKATEIFKVFSF